MVNKFNKCVVFCTLFALLGCEEYLDVSPDFGITENEVFSDVDAARGYLDNCYKSLTDMHAFRPQNLSRTIINALSDEAGTLYVDGLNTLLNTGAWINRPQLGEVGWTGRTRTSRGTIPANAFYALRVANRVIERIDDIPNVSGSDRDQLLGQAHFFRAWFFFQLIRRYGGMPRLDKAFSSSEDANLPRMTYSESTEFLLADLEIAIDLLPDAWGEANVGRANKAAAMGVKEMAMLYAASPLMQNGLESIQKMPYGQEWSERAADAANDLIQYIEGGAGGTGIRLMNGDEYRSIFYTDGIEVSPESIWYNYDGGDRNQFRGLRCMYLPQWFSGGTGVDATAYSNPTQNIVDMYEVLNNGQAYDIDDPRSGYDPQNPYENRDPRLYNNVLLPGERWGVDFSGNPAYQELYVGGRDYQRTVTSQYTRSRQLSGYMCKKYIWPETSRSTNQTNLFNLNHIFIRVSQIYLDYAEAMNEAYGPTSDPQGYGLTAVEAINVIRNRVDMPDVRPEQFTSKEVFRDKIRQERAVELMWENHRWFDLRRWMIAEEVLSQPIRGVRATPPAGHENVADKSTLDFEFEVIELTTEQRVFDTRHYWYPVPQPDVLNLSNFNQNPGW